MTSPEQEQVKNDKEYNFRALEAKFQNRLQEVEAEKERLRQELEARNNQPEEEEESEPYVDHKKLNKTLAKHGQVTQTEIAKAMEKVRHETKEEVKRDLWLENNPDFYDTLKHAEKFAQKNPHLADTILKMPEGFERQKLVYQNIKALGLDSPEQKQPSIQEKIDANKRSPYYQPSGVGTAPYAGQQGDFSPTGQKDAYNKMLELKARLRI